MDAALPLAGIRVLDLTRLLPGPAATMHLADMGAQVIKIEDPGPGDYARVMGPVRNEVSQFFVAVNRGKQFIRLDLKDAAQRERLLAMVEQADVLVESFRPGVMDKLGLGWSALRERNPKLVMCSISGYGQDGPYAQLAGHDINYIGYAGMLEQTAGADGAPVLPNLQVGDLLGGAQSALQGMLAALVAVKMGGAGRHVDVSMTDAVLAHNLMPLVAINNGRAAVPGRDLLTGGVPCYNVYRTSDGRHKRGDAIRQDGRVIGAGVGRDGAEELVQRFGVAAGELRAWKAVRPEADAELVVPELFVGCRLDRRLDGAAAGIAAAGLVDQVGREMAAEEDGLEAFAPVSGGLPGFRELARAMPHDDRVFPRVDGLLVECINVVAMERLARRIERLSRIECSGRRHNGAPDGEAALILNDQRIWRGCQNRAGNKPGPDYDQPRGE